MAVVDTLEVQIKTQSDATMQSLENLKNKIKSTMTVLNTMSAKTATQFDYAAIISQNTTKRLLSSFQIADKGLKKEISSLNQQLVSEFMKLDINFINTQERLQNTLVNSIKQSDKIIIEDFQRVKEYLKAHKITVSDMTMQNIDKVWWKDVGSKFSQYFNRGLRSAKVSAVDVAWKELQSITGKGLFPDSIANEEEQLRHIVSILEQAKNMTTGVALSAEGVANAQNHVRNILNQEVYDLENIQKIGNKPMGEYIVEYQKQVEVAEQKIRNLTQEQTRLKNVMYDDSSARTSTNKEKLSEYDRMIAKTEALRTHLSGQIEMFSKMQSKYTDFEPMIRMFTQLSESVNSLDVSKIQMLATSIKELRFDNRNLNSFVNALSRISKVNGAELEKVSIGTKELSSSLIGLNGVDGENLSKTSKGLIEISNSFNSLKKSQKGLSLANTVNQVEKFQRINADTLLKNALAIKNLGSAMQRLSDASKSMATFTTALGELTMATKNMNFDSRKLNSFVKAMNSVSTLNGKSIMQIGIGTKELSSSLATLGAVKFDNKNILKTLNSISLLANSGINNIDIGKIKELGNAIREMANQLTNIGSVNKSITSMIAAVSRLAGVADGIPKVTTSLGTFGAELKKFINSMSQVDKVSKRTVAFTQAIAQLANSGRYIQTTIQNLEPLSQALLKFFQSMQSANKISGNTLQFTQAIAQLASAGSASSGINALTNSLGGLNNNASNSQSILYNLWGVISNVAVSWGKLAYGAYNVGSALLKMAWTSVDVKFNLISSAEAANIYKASLEKLKVGALSIISSFGNMLKTLVNLKNVFVLVGEKVQALKSKFSSYGSAANGMIRHNNLIQASFNKLTSAIGLFYARYFLVMRAIKLIWKSAESSMDYVETFNFYNVALKKMGHDTESTADEVGSKTGEKLTDSIKQAVSDGTDGVVDESKKLVEKTTDEINKKLDNATEKKMNASGKKSAEEYTNAFRSEIDTLTQKMTGFKIDESGALIDTGTIGLGLDPEQLMSFQAKILSITNSVGMMGNVSTMTSKALSMLSSDLSSLTNTDLDTVMDNLTSGLIGQSRALYKYGIDITNTTLAELAATEGISKKISKMTQQEKMQLRILAILRQSKISWADQANTLNSVANQYRILKQQVQNLGRTIGNLLMPILQRVLPMLNGMVIAINRVLEKFGLAKYGNNWKNGILDGISSGNIEGLDDLEDTSDAVEDIGDEADNSKKKIKELAKQLQGIDELNNLSQNNDNDDSSSSSSGSSDDSVGTIDLSGAIAEELANYEKIWNEAYEKSVNDAEKWAEAISDAFANKFVLGTKVRDLIIKAFDIDWKKDVYPKFNNWGSNLASFMVGLITPNDKGETVFSALGSAVAAGVNSAIVAFEGWADTFTKLGGWEKFGKGVASYLTTIIDDIKWEDEYKVVTKIAKGLAKTINSFTDTEVFNKIGKAIAKLLRSGIDAWGKLVGENGIDFSNLGSKIGDGITKFFDEMNIKNKDTKLTGWEQLGKDISDSIIGIETALGEAIKAQPFIQVGQAIADTIGAIKWEDIAWKLGELTKQIAEQLYKLISKTGTWSKLGNRIATGINAYFTAIGEDGFKKIGQTIYGTFKGIVTAFTTAVNKINWDDIGKAIGEMLEGIKWQEAWFDLTKAATAVVKALAKTVYNITKTSPKTASMALFLGAGYLALKGVSSAMKTALTTTIAGNTFKLAKSAGAIKVAGLAITLGGAIATITGIKKGDIVQAVSGSIATTLGILSLTNQFTLPNVLKIGLPVTIAVVAITWADDIRSQLIQASTEESTEAGKSILQQALDDMFADMDSGDFKIQLPFGFELPSDNEFKEWQKNARNAIKGLLSDIEQDIINFFHDVFVKAMRKLPSVVQSALGVDEMKLSTEGGSSTHTSSSGIITGGNGVKVPTSSIPKETNYTSPTSLTLELQTDKKPSVFVDEVINGNDGILKTWNSNNPKGTVKTSTDKKGSLLATDTIKSWNTQNPKATLTTSTNKSGSKLASETEKSWNSKSPSLVVGISSNTTTKTLWTNLQDKWNGSSKNLLVGLKAFSGSSIKSLWNDGDDSLVAKWSKSDKKLSVGLKDFNNTQISNLYGNSSKGLVKTWGTKNLSVGMNLKSNTLSSLKTETSNYFNKKENAIDIKLNATGLSIAGIPSSVYDGTIYTKKALGGVYSGGTWKSIDQYASGGIPTKGTHFIAGESGAEAVGHINGRTEVLNQSQMASVMYNAVYNAMNTVMSNQRSNSGDTVVQIDGREIARATRDVANDYMRRTGNPYFAY